MQEKTESLKPNRYEKIIEASTWIVVVLVIFFVRFWPQNLIGSAQVYYLIGGIVAFALLYYFIIYKYFSRTNRLYLKEIADIIFIGILIHVVKDYGQYFFALYFLPIAAAALTLEFINALIIAAIASIFVVFEVILSSQALMPQVNEFYQGAWQIGLILFITIFCRALAVQLREEKIAKEESLVRQKALEEEAERNKEFLSLTSHQLFTPLSMIRGFASLLKDGKYGQLNPKQKEAVAEVYANSKRMVNLVSELLSISRIQAGSFELNLEETKIDQLLTNIVKQFQETKTNKNVELEFSPPAELLPIKIDADKIRGVVYNLIDNAVKYTPKGKIEITLEQNPKETTIKIIDEGIGLKQEDFKKLFQPFFRSKNILELDNSGTGLGLYIARLIVEKHGGKIWAENNPDQGATFTFSMPNKK